MSVFSQNGYIADVPALVSSRPVPGTNVKLAVRIGPAGDLLLHAAARWNAEVEGIDNARGGLDDWGYAERPIRGSTTELSNHASGTAIDLNATRHPLGTAAMASLTPAQVRAIHAIIADCAPALRWGGDYTGRTDPMHLEIVAAEDVCRAVLARLAPAGHPTVTRGDRGPAVEQVQRTLHVAPVSGWFGPLTEAAVRAFQSAHGLVVDGIVGPATWAALA